MSAAAAAGPGVRALAALGTAWAEGPGAGVGWVMSAWEGAPGAGSQPGTDRGWGRWWGVAALGGEATCLGWEERVFPGGNWGLVRAQRLRSRRKGERGTQWEEEEGRGPQLPDTLVQPPPHPHVTSWALGLGSNPTSTRAQETHLSGFTALSFFFGLKERPTETRRRRIRKAKHPTLLPRSQAYPGSTLGNLVPLWCTTMPSTPQAWSLQAQKWGLAGTCIHTGCVLPGTFPPADCSDTGS